MGRPAPIDLNEDERDHVQVFVRRGYVRSILPETVRQLLKKTR